MKTFKRKIAAFAIGGLFVCFGAFVACKSAALEESSSSASNSVLTSSTLISNPSSIESYESVGESASSASMHEQESSTLYLDGSSIISDDSSVADSSFTENSSSTASEDSSEFMDSSVAIESSTSESSFDDSSIEQEIDSSSQAQHEHTFTESIYREPTCLETGLLIKTCTECYYETSETIDSLGHDEIVDIGYAPTCKEVGKTDGSHCSRCKIPLISQEEIPTIDHSYQFHICIWCNRTSLKFELHSSKEYYICVGAEEEEIIRYLKIPSEYDGKPVKKIAARAFTGNLYLIYVELPETIEAIGDAAFADCFNLFEVCNHSKIKPNENAIWEHGDVFTSAKHIFNDEKDSRISTDEAGYITYTHTDNEVYLIGYCGRETALIVPDAVTIVNSRVFCTVNGLKSVVISSNIKKLLSYTFIDCLSLEKVVIGSGVKKIEPYLFGYNGKPAFLQEIIFKEIEGWVVIDQKETPLTTKIFQEQATLFFYLFEEYSEYDWERK